MLGLIFANWQHRISFPSMWQKSVTVHIFSLTSGWLIIKHIIFHNIFPLSQILKPSAVNNQGFWHVGTSILQWNISRYYTGYITLSDPYFWSLYRTLHMAAGSTTFAAVSLYHQSRCTPFRPMNIRFLLTIFKEGTGIFIVASFILKSM